MQLIRLFSVFEMEVLEGQKVYPLLGEGIHKCLFTEVVWQVAWDSAGSKDVLRNKHWFMVLAMALALCSRTVPEVPSSGEVLVLPQVPRGSRLDELLWHELFKGCTVSIADIASKVSNLSSCKCPLLEQINQTLNRRLQCLSKNKSPDLETPYM